MASPPAGWSRWVGGVAATAAAIAAFLPALSPDFVNWDDSGILILHAGTALIF